MKKFLFLMLLLLCNAAVFAQQAGNDVEMADALRSSGKIYVVIGTISIIFIGLAIFLFSMDRRLRKLEQ